MITREQCYETERHLDPVFVAAYLCKQPYGKDLSPASAKAVAEAICATNKRLLSWFEASQEERDAHGGNDNDWSNNIVTSEDGAVNKLCSLVFTLYYFERGWSVNVVILPRLSECWVEGRDKDPDGIWYYGWRNRDSGLDESLQWEYVTYDPIVEFKDDADRLVIGDVLRVR